MSRFSGSIVNRYEYAVVGDVRHQDTEEGFKTNSVHVATLTLSDDDDDSSPLHSDESFLFPPLFPDRHDRHRPDCLDCVMTFCYLNGQTCLALPESLPESLPDTERVCCSGNPGRLDSHFTVRRAVAALRFVWISNPVQCLTSKPLAFSVCCQ